MAAPLVATAGGCAVVGAASASSDACCALAVRAGDWLVEANCDWTPHLLANSLITASDNSTSSAACFEALALSSYLAAMNAASFSATALRAISEAEQEPLPSCCCCTGSLMLNRKGTTISSARAVPS